METQIVKSQTFEEKLGERIKKDIGDLIPDADLQAIVKKAMHKAFFHEKVIYDNYHREISREMPFIIDHVKSLIEERVDKQIKTWMADHDKDIMKMINDKIEEGIMGVCMRSFTALMQPDMNQLGYAVESKLIELRNNNML